MSLCSCVTLVVSGHLEVREQRYEYSSVQLLAASLLVAELHGRIHLVAAIRRRERYLCLTISQSFVESTNSLIIRSETTPCLGKKGATSILPVTLQNANRFSKFFYHHTLQ